MNEKAGMDTVELDKYLTSSILPLFPDVEDKPRKKEIIKVDSGPERTDVNMLVYMHTLGMYCVPGVPNITNVTQETDQNYDLFKPIFRDNIDILS